MSYLQFCKVHKVMVLRYGCLMSPETLPDKITPDVNFKDKTVVQCDVPVVKILLQVLVIYKWLQINFDVNTYVLFVDPVLFIVLVS